MGRINNRLTDLPCPYCLAKPSCIVGDRVKLITVNTKTTL